MKKVSVFWFSRDLWLEDNTGLLKSLAGEYLLFPIYIFDSNILRDLAKDDSRISFIHDTQNHITNLLN